MGRFKLIMMLLISMFIITSCGESDEVVSSSLEFPLELNVNEEYDIDLNNDEVKENLILEANNQIVNLVVNEKINELDFIDLEMINSTYRIVDIDENDENLDIAIKEACPPMNDCIFFLRLVDDEIINLGEVYISSLYESGEDIILDGDGIVKALGSSKIMSDGHFEIIYKLSEFGKLEQVVPELYVYNKEIESDVYENIKVYENMLDDSDSVEIISGEKITIIGEKSNWLKIKWNDSIYWINGDDLTHFDPDYPDVKFEFDGISFWS